MPISSTLKPSSVESTGNTSGSKGSMGPSTTIFELSSPSITTSLNVEEPFTPTKPTNTAYPNSRSAVSTIVHEEPSLDEWLEIEFPSLVILTQVEPPTELPSAAASLGTER